MPEARDAAPPLAEVLQAAALTYGDVVAGASLDRALERHAAGAPPRMRAATQDLSYTAVRRRALSEWLIAELAQRPPSAPVAALLAVALPQLVGDGALRAQAGHARAAAPHAVAHDDAHGVARDAAAAVAQAVESRAAAPRHAAHTVVDQAVAAARAQPATAVAAGFVNAVLRNCLRQRDALLGRAQRDETVVYNAPAWWIDALRTAQPMHWRDVLLSAAEPPPLVLRVSTARTTVAALLERLAANDMPALQVGAQAVALERAVPVARIPGFAEGDVSVQDAGAQLAAPWLAARPGQRVLDACAAPGGKTVHLVELGATDVTALERDAARATRIGDNLRRIGQADAVRIQVADGRDVGAWWDGRPFDRILLDAPCTASGIVRRHPDIPWLRRPADVAQLTTLQAELLDALWPVLGVGGRLLYVVCSVFPQEGREQASRFAARHPDAVAMTLPGGAPCIELLPTAVREAGFRDGGLPTVHDGFCYALFEKSG